MARPLCTVLIPFDAAGQARFALLAAVGTDLGYRTMRVAQYYSSGVILEEIVRSIRDAHLIIADLTEANPNVYYELGIAHTLGKRAFLTSEDPQSCPIRFRGLAVCKLEATDGGRDRLHRELHSFVKTPGILSPIDLFTGGLAVAGQRLLGRRAAAFLLDFVILVPMLFLTAALTATGIPATYGGAAFAAAVPVYFLATSIFLETTPGQRILRLKVTRLDRSRPYLWQRVMRPVAAMLNVLSLGAGFLWGARSPRYQAVHDFITRTLVLRNTPSSPYVHERTSPL